MIGEPQISPGRRNWGHFGNVSGIHPLQHDPLEPLAAEFTGAASRGQSHILNPFTLEPKTIGFKSRGAQEPWVEQP